MYKNVNLFFRSSFHACVLKILRDLVHNWKVAWKEFTLCKCQNLVTFFVQFSFDAEFIEKLFSKKIHNEVIATKGLIHTGFFGGPIYNQSFFHVFLGIWCYETLEILY